MSKERLHEIGRELRWRRAAAGLTDAEIASRAGVPELTVSQVEMGERASDPEAVLRLFAVLDMEEAEAKRLAVLVRAAYAETAPPQIERGVCFRPGAAVELGEQATAVWGFGAFIIPGPLRTAEYSAQSALFIGSGLVNWAAVLADESRLFTFVLAEAALRTRPGSGTCLPGQIAHLLTLAERPNVRLGIVPGSADGWPRLPLHGFTVFGTFAVTVETFTREVTYTDAAEVRRYADVFREYERHALFGTEARRMLGMAACSTQETT